jgi:mRNA interferase MazF
MTHVEPGEVWMADMGIAGKVRPVLILTPTPSDDELVLLTVVQHTTAEREENPWQVYIRKSWLNEGVFHVQRVDTIAPARLMRRLGMLTTGELNLVKERLRERLAL